MLLEKTTWFNNAQAAAVLTIDDLTNGYLDMDGRGLCAANDWGFMGRRAGSVFRYFEDHILRKFPEVKYTVFAVLGPHCMAMVDCQRPRHAGSAFDNPEFLDLLRYVVASGNEVAYHGHHHGRTDGSLDPYAWQREYEQLDPDKYRQVVEEDIRRLRQATGIEMRGGRSPGYQDQPWVLRMMAELGMRWWSSRFTPFQCAWGYQDGLCMFPTSISGSCLNKSRATGIRGILSAIRWRPEASILKMIQGGQLLCVAEHFLRSRPDGRSQGPSLYVDVNSLDLLFGMLRQHDIWYATCSEIAWYRDSFDFTEVVAGGGSCVEIRYGGRYERPLLSLVSDCRRLRKRVTGQVLEGGYKRGRWVFSSLEPGVYEAC